MPENELPNAVAWSALSWQAAIVGGPAIGGFLYAWGGADLVYAVAACMLLIGAVAMGGIRRPLRAVQVAGETIRITSYNVCYTKLLRAPRLNTNSTRKIHKAQNPRLLARKFARRRRLSGDRRIV